jgi:nitronate monooxygenase
MTRVISGRPARCIANELTRLGSGVAHRQIPAFPIAYGAGRALIAAAKRAGETGYGAHWAGQGAPLARTLPAAELVATLAKELR